MRLFLTSLLDGVEWLARRFESIRLSPHVYKFQRTPRSGVALLYCALQTCKVLARYFNVIPKLLNVHVACLLYL
jgi:hypothetical protein